MGLAVVGVSTIATAASTDPENFLLPLPMDAEVGDFLAVGVGTFGVEITDSRLTEVASERGGYGIATDLSDVTLTTSGMYPGLAICVALRRISLGPLEADSNIDGDYTFTTPLNGDGFIASVAFVSDADNEDNEVSTAAGWTDLGEVSQTGPASSFLSLRGFHYSGSDPVPDLDPTDSSGGGGGARLAFWLLWPTRDERPWLRQRQSPHANPRVSANRPQLRQRQRFL